MPNPLKTQAIKAFLQQFTHLDLASLYHAGMEVQVLTAKDGADEIKGDYKGREWRAYENPKTNDKWKDFRIPRNGKTNPEYEDTPISYDLLKHAEGIGLTGWNWVERQSEFFGYDFDAISGHAVTHGKKMSQEELDHLREVTKEIPWVTIRKSTSGKGLHFYVFIEPITTNNHDEHAALAKAILSHLSGVCGLDFHAKVDAMGHVMWFWHRKMKGTDGLTLLKQGVRLEKLPIDWKDQVPVITGQVAKSRPWFVVGEKKEEDAFSQMTATRPVIKRDDEHMKLCSFLEEIGGSWWNADHNMLVTHSALLKEAHEKLQLRGPFDTVATGSHRGADHNVFCHPLRGGAWVVRRFTRGVDESPSWDKDSAGWTRCYLNREPDLDTASRACNGIEREGYNGGYEFSKAEDAQRAARMLGVELNLNVALNVRKAVLKKNPKDGRLVVWVEKEENDTAAGIMQGWRGDKKQWKRIFNSKAEPPQEMDSSDIDQEIRHIVSQSGKDLGWVIYSDGMWRDEPLAHVRPALGARGYKPPEANLIVGSAVFRPWTIVCKPFEVEEPGHREWNRHAPQLKFAPSREEEFKHPTWDSILRHCGKGLDREIIQNEWAKTNGIQTGAAYLKVWIASMFQYPFEPLPYLFFHSKEQDTGKSTFHEAIELLLTKGYVRADNALTSGGNFNGELEGALLCVIEETDLRKIPSAYSKIKDWVTSRQLPIHVKGKTPYHVPNTTHYVQCANSHMACPVFTGDTRITMMHVEPIPFTEMIPKKSLIEKLTKEAPDFLGDILSMQLPAPVDRLNIPVISTSEKLSTEMANESLLESYIRDKCHYVPGAVIKLGEFYTDFKMWLDEFHPGQDRFWTKIRTGKEMPPQFPKGRYNGAEFYYSNISYTPGTGTRKLYLQGEYLKEEK